MNAIIGFAELLSKRNIGECEKTYVDSIMTAGKNLLAIINDILDISKIESGMMDFTENAFSVKEIFKSLNVLLKEKIKEKDVKLLFICDEDVPEVLIGDDIRLTQIIINLAGNAIKFTKKGKVLVNAKVFKIEKGKTLLEFSVKTQV